MEHEIELKLSELLQYQSIHHWLQHQLQLPEYYGHNLDALWDCLHDLPLPITIFWYNDNDDRTDYSQFTSLFEEAASEIPGFSFHYMIEKK